MDIKLETTRVMTPLGIGTVVNRVASTAHDPEARIWLIRFDKKDFKSSEYEATFPQGGNCRFFSFNENELSEVGKISSHTLEETSDLLGSSWTNLKNGLSYTLEEISTEGVCKMVYGPGKSEYYNVSLKNLEKRYSRVK